MLVSCRECICFINLLLLLKFLESLSGSASDIIFLFLLFVVIALCGVVSSPGREWDVCINAFISFLSFLIFSSAAPEVINCAACYSLLVLFSYILFTLFRAQYMIFIFLIIFSLIYLLITFSYHSERTELHQTIYSATHNIFSNLTRIYFLFHTFSYIYLHTWRDKKNTTLNWNIPLDVARLKVARIH